MDGMNYLYIEEKFSRLHYPTIHHNS